MGTLIHSCGPGTGFELRGPAGEIETYRFKGAVTEDGRVFLRFRRRGQPALLLPVGQVTDITPGVEAAVRPDHKIAFSMSRGWTWHRLGPPRLAAQKTTDEPV
jgi:hypothetical protein